MEFGVISCNYGESYPSIESFLFVYMVGAFVMVVLLSLRALLDRHRAESQGLFDACEYVLKNLAQRYKGEFYKFNSHRLVCLLPQRNLFLEVEGESFVQFRIFRESPHKQTVWKKWLHCGEVSEDNITGWIKCAENGYRKAWKISAKEPGS